MLYHLAVKELDLIAVLLSAVAGVTFFLLGMQNLGASLKELAGGTLRNALSTFTRSRISALMTGAFVTTGLQSSGATTLFLVGLSGAGLIQLRQALGVILGADIGTTITVQLVAFDLFKWSPLALLFGWLVSVLGSTGKIRNVGRFILGIGLLFFGMGLMAQSMKPMGELEWVRSSLAGLSEWPVLGILASAVFTALVRSSSTTVVLAVSLASVGAIGLKEALPIILGANIGTCSTALIGAIGMGRDGWRIALGHVIFKVAGVLAILPFLGYFAEFVQSTSAWLGVGAGREVANAHTLFNLFVALMFTPFVGVAERLIVRLVPERERGEGLLKWIRPSLEIVPEAALASVRREIVELLGDLEKLLRSSERSIANLDEVAAEDVRKAKTRFNAALAEVNTYLARIRRCQVSPSEREECSRLMFATRSINHVVTGITVTLAEIRDSISRSTETLPMESNAGIRKHFSVVREILSGAKEAAESGKCTHTALGLQELVDEELRLQEHRLKRQVPGAGETSFAFSEIMLQLFTVGRELEQLGQTLCCDAPVLKAGE